MIEFLGAHAETIITVLFSGGVVAGLAKWLDYRNATRLADLQERKEGVEGDLAVRQDDREAVAFITDKYKELAEKADEAAAQAAQLADNWRQEAEKLRADFEAYRKETDAKIAQIRTELKACEAREAAAIKRADEMQAAVARLEAHVAKLESK